MLRKWLAFGRAVVYYARVAHAFSARIKCQHCICLFVKLDVAFNR